MQSLSNMLLEGISKISIHQIATKNQVIISWRLLPNQVVLNPLDSARKVLGVRKDPPFFGAVLSPQMQRHFPEAATGIAALLSPFQATVIAITG